MQMINLIIISLVSFIVLIKSADFGVRSISNFAKKLGISEYLIGFLIVSIGTSLPELTTAIAGSAAGQGKLVLGNIIGANILNVTLVLGVMSLIGKKIFIKSKILDETQFVIMAIIIMPLILSLDSVLSRLDGVILLFSFTLYILSLWRKEGRFGKVAKDVKLKYIYKDIITFVIAIPILLLSARYLVNSAVTIASLLDIPSYVIGLTFIAMGTTLPELTVGIKTVLKGHNDIGFGEIMGSVIANSSLVLGLAAIISPIMIEMKLFINAAMFMITAVFIGLLFLKKEQITWQEGISLILIYLTFFISTSVLL